jgi:flagellar biosynthetic protein FliR
MGFTAYITFESIHLAAQFMGTQMGFGAAGMYDPHSQTQSTALVPLAGWMALVLFLGADLHHQWLYGFTKSFALTEGTRLGAFSSAGLMAYWLKISAELFTLSAQMALPFTLVVLACNIAMGILSRTLPQMNLLYISYPLTLLVGFAALYLLVPEMTSIFENTLEESTSRLLTFLKTL